MDLLCQPFYRRTSTSPTDYYQVSILCRTSPDLVHQIFSSIDIFNVSHSNLDIGWIIGGTAKSARKLAKTVRSSHKDNGGHAMYFPLTSLWSERLRTIRQRPFLRKTKVNREHLNRYSQSIFGSASVLDFSSISIALFFVWQEESAHWTRKTWISYQLIS